MASLVVTRTRKASGSATSEWSTPDQRSQASCTASSASVTLPRTRYATETSRPRCSSKTRAGSGVRSPEVPTLTLPPRRTVAYVVVPHTYKTHRDPGSVTFPVWESRVRPTCQGLPRAVRLATTWARRHAGGFDGLRIRVGPPRHEPADVRDELCGLILGDQRVGIRNLDQPGVRKQLGQPTAVLARHDAILRSPHDEDGSLEGALALRPFEQHVLRWHGARVLAKVAPYLPPREHGAEPRVHDLVRDRALAHPAPRERQAPQGAQPERLEGGVDPAWHLRCEPCRFSRETRRVVVEGLARDEHESSDPLRASLGDEQLRPAPVVAHERHVAEVQALQELGHQPDHRAKREVGVGAHRPAMPTERQGRQDASVVRAQAGDDVAPQ